MTALEPHPHPVTIHHPVTPPPLEHLFFRLKNLNLLIHLEKKQINQMRFFYLKFWANLSKFLRAVNKLSEKFQSLNNVRLNL